MKNLENGTEFIWPKEKFLNRLYLMKEMYNNYEEEEEDWDLPEDKDPFQEDVNTEVKLGFSLEDWTYSLKYRCFVNVNIHVR
jgi:hypothetical protein